MNTYQIEQIDDFSTFSLDVYLDKKFILLPNHIPLDAKLKSKLIESSFFNIYSEGEIEDLGIRKELEEKKTDSEDDQKDNEDPQVAQVIEEEKNQELEIEREYIAFLTHISNLYSTYASHQKIDVKKVFEISKNLCDFVNTNKHKIVKLPKESFKDLEPGLILHVMRSTIFAIIIAIQVKMPENRIIELAVAGVLHKIGFLRLPPQFYADNLNSSEKDLKTFMAHPVISYRILKDAGFPTTVCAGVLEHHEREDGSGYPRGLKAENISIFGKILSVACSFEASTGDFKNTHGVNSVLEVVRNSNKQYSDVILKSLLFSISVFPIGTFVQLSDKRIGQVVDINPDDLAYPVVLIYGGMSARGEAQIANTSPNGIKIRKPLTKAEIDEVKRTKTTPPSGSKV